MIEFKPSLFLFYSDQRLQGRRDQQQQPRAAPGYEELDAARRRVLDHDPHRVSGKRVASLRKRPGPPLNNPFEKVLGLVARRASLLALTSC